MKILAPAKVNLYLRVVGKRRDGYHLIDSLMVPVSLYDEIEITKPRTARSVLTVTCDDPIVPVGKKNLAYKAAALVLDRASVSEPVHIHIRKKIPVGGGLGGGSSDAAATMRGLNQHLGLGVSKRSMLDLATQLGADVPFFVHGRPAIARGIGERLKLLTSVPKLWIIILYPGFPVSTRWAYQSLKFKLTKVIRNTKLNLHLDDYGELAPLLVNDLEGVTIRRYPRIAHLKERLLQEGATGALMSGSGSSVFGIFAAEKRANKAFRCMQQEEQVRAFLVRLLT
ncbi:MAG: 4-(cytidine 5'-diphospho)-2-C-methyl-D-erythritol kinase [Deltaproteobacteria bacterium]|nr:4-(cytidine 5'-diphospho)-2-C-methyl-D-erythritol kinase [Deltaproteobacteria bacterium]